MSHFLDINTTDPAALRQMIEHAQTMKSARVGQPRGSPEDHLPMDGHMAATLWAVPWDVPY